MREAEGGPEEFMRYRAKGIIEVQEDHMEVFLLRLCYAGMVRTPREAYYSHLCADASLYSFLVRSVGILFTMTLKKTFCSGLRGGSGMILADVCCVLLFRDQDPSATL